MVAQGDRQYLDAEVPGSEVALKTGGIEFTHSAITESLMTMSAMMTIGSDATVSADMPDDLLRKIMLGMLLPIYKGAAFDLAEAKEKHAIVFRSAGDGRVEAQTGNGKALYTGYTIPECPGLLSVAEAGAYNQRRRLFARRRKNASKPQGIQAGCPLPETGIRMVKQDLDGIGEICVSGAGLAVTSEDWIHTGKLGYVDDRGLLHITGDVTDRFVGDGLGSKA